VSNPERSFSGLLKHLGPGLVFAGTCIGVSHVVQSTRAGAVYGYGLLWAVIAANVIKFPFFEFAPRYVMATGEHLLEGYRRVGQWAFYLFIVLSLLSMFPIQSAVTLVTTGLFVNLFHWPYPPVMMAGVVLLICSAILLMGKYKMLEKSMKFMIVLLGVSTVFAFIIAVCRGSSAQPQFVNTFQWDTDIGFLVALMGWMPTTFEIGVWLSFWTLEHIKKSKTKVNMKDSKLDFHVGYWGTTVMAVLFLSLGALVMYGTGEVFSNSAVTFTGQVISLYVKALGQWSYPIIVVAASVTMFSTTLACLDAFPRVARETALMLFPSVKGKEDSIYVGWLAFVAIGSLVIIGLFVNNMKALVDFATTLAFVAAPVFAYMNLRAVTSYHMPVEHRPSKGLLLFSWIGLVCLMGFALFYIYWRFFLS